MSGNTYPTVGGRDTRVARRSDEGKHAGSKARIRKSPHHCFGRGRDKARAMARIRPAWGRVSGSETKSESRRYDG